jgi:hypothetical protein
LLADAGQIDALKRARNTHCEMLRSVSQAGGSRAAGDVSMVNEVRGLIAKSP